MPPEGRDLLQPLGKGAGRFGVAAQFAQHAADCNSARVALQG